MPNDIRPAETRVDVSSRLAVPGTAVVTQSRLTWRAALVLTWLMGLLGMLTVIVVSNLRLAGLGRRMPPVEEQPWLALVQ
jgi:hypothetical protein